ncbi:hypothetical protein MAPG_09211 [Magnaporthiopsis poae ATCC 64411]|uniref:Uncharacterized protein n=1 Tax=Magnaporthiopsis poae (strain ATCC 64411 / 73-15) TaxID=644358 RepID=A0A0C4E9D1_MAGP6|nr:hypothetical protein MAPG_09211 [Magnaporthiopsis poae ATCC 64411]
MARFLLGNPPPSLQPLSLPCSTQEWQTRDMETIQTPTKMMSNGQLRRQDACVRGPVGEPRPSNLQTRVFAWPGQACRTRAGTSIHNYFDARDAEPTTRWMREKSRGSAPARTRSQRPQPIESQDRLA